MKNILFYLISHIFIITFFYTSSFCQENPKDKAKKYIENKQYQKAIEIYENILADSTNDIESQKTLAKLYSWVKKYSRSLETYKKILAKYPKDYDIIFAIAQVFSWKGNNDTAIKIYTKITNESPDYIDAYTGLGRIYFWEKNYISSIHILEKGLNRDPTNEDMINLMVDNYYLLGDYKKAKIYNKKLLKINPESSIGLNYRKNLSLYSFDLTFGYDNVNIMENWKDGNITFLYKPHKRFTAIFQGSSYKRFGKDDEQISTEIYVGLSQNLYFQSLLGFGTKNNFLPKQRFNGELSYNAGNGSVFNIGINLLNFPEELISIYTSGYTFYFPKYFFLDYKYYYSSGKEDIFNSTHLMRLNYLIEKKIRISAGYAYGGEAFHIISSQEVSNIKSHSYISYLTFWFNPSFGIRTLLSYTKRENTYKRTTINAGFIFNF